MFTLISSSLYHLTLIAWERYVAIRKWIDYKVIVTTRRTKKLALVAWLLAAFASFPILVMTLVGVDLKIKRAWQFGESIVAAGCLITLAYLYIMIYLGVRKRKIDQISQVTTLVQAKLESKVAKTTGLITAAFILSFLPGIIIVALRNVHPVPLTNPFRLMDALIQLNSVANLLIYFYKLRPPFKKYCAGALRSQKTQSSSVSSGCRAICQTKRSVWVTGSCPRIAKGGTTHPLRKSSIRSILRPDIGFRLHWSKDSWDVLEKIHVSSHAKPIQRLRRWSAISASLVHSSYKGTTYKCSNPYWKWRAVSNED